MSTILALDYGKKRVGVAVSDPTGTIASPLPFVPLNPFKGLIRALKEIIAEREVTTVLVGLPRNMDGSEGQSAEDARQFAGRIKEALVIEVIEVDERLSTVQASRLLHEAGYDTRKQKKKIDSASAQVLLQQFLDSRSL